MQNPRGKKNRGYVSVAMVAAIAVLTTFSLAVAFSHSIGSQDFQSRAQVRVALPGPPAQKIALPQYGGQCAAGRADPGLSCSQQEVCQPGMGGRREHRLPVRRDFSVTVECAERVQQFPGLCERARRRFREPTQFINARRSMTMDKKRDGAIDEVVAEHNGDCTNNNRN